MSIDVERAVALWLRLRQEAGTPRAQRFPEMARRPYQRHRCKRCRGTRARQKLVAGEPVWICATPGCGKRWPLKRPEPDLGPRGSQRTTAPGERERDLLTELGVCLEAVDPAARDVLLVYVHYGRVELPLRHDTPGSERMRRDEATAWRTGVPRRQVHRLKDQAERALISEIARRPWLRRALVREDAEGATA